MSILDLVIKDNFSPNGNYYFKFKEPDSLNPSTFGSKIAFYDNSDNLLYHHKSAYAHELNDPVEVEEIRAYMSDELDPKESTTTAYRLRFVTWSKQGNIAHILEYFVSNQKYYHVLINFKEHYQLRALYADSNKKEYISINSSMLIKLGIFKPNFDEVLVLEAFDKLGFNNKLPLIKDQVHSGFFSKLLPKNKWHL